MAEFADVENEIASVGEPAIKQLWKSLGLTFTEGPDRSLCIYVTDPD